MVAGRGDCIWNHWGRQMNLESVCFRRKRSQTRTGAPPTARKGTASQVWEATVPYGIRVAPGEALDDAGHFSEEELAALEERGVAVHAALGSEGLKISEIDRDCLLLAIRRSVQHPIQSGTYLACRAVLHCPNRLPTGQSGERRPERERSGRSRSFPSVVDRSGQNEKDSPTLALFASSTCAKPALKVAPPPRSCETLPPNASTLSPPSGLEFA